MVEGARLLVDRLLQVWLSYGLGTEDDARVSCRVVFLLVQRRKVVGANCLSNLVCVQEVVQVCTHTYPFVVPLHVCVCVWSEQGKSLYAIPTCLTRDKRHLLVADIMRC